MFGYIRPLAEELQMKEFYRFKACYCGLCHSLKREYGFFARFILNYDFIFLAMLLWDTEEVSYEFKYCAASPCKKKCICQNSPAYEECAAKSLILAYWKLQDDKKDEKLFKSALAASARFVLKSKYKKAAAKYPDFDSAVSRYLKELDLLERGGASLDETADKFAALLASLADSVDDESKRRILSQIFYHSGRVIYIIDAVDDLEEDAKAGRFNPVAVRYSVSDGRLTDEQKRELRLTLSDSFAVISADYDLFPKSKWSPILHNIIHMGLPDVADKVFAGSFRNTRVSFPNDKKLTI